MIHAIKNAIKLYKFKIMEYTEPKLEDKREYYAS